MCVVVEKFIFKNYKQRRDKFSEFTTREMQGELARSDQVYNPFAATDEKESGMLLINSSLNQELGSRDT